MFALLGKNALWWILGTLATGVVVASVMSPSSEGEVETIRIIHDPSEKFMDPLYLMWGTGAYSVTALDSATSSPRPPGLGLYIHRYTMANDQNEVHLWLEYFNGIERNGASRIVAMRNVMAARKAKQGIHPVAHGMILPGLVLQSRDTLYKIGNDIATTYDTIAKSASAAEGVAEKLGVSTATVRDEANAMLAYAKTVTDYKLIDEAIKKYGPVARATVRAIITAISIGTSDGTDKEKAVAVINGLADVALMIPGYGMVISGALRIVGGTLQSSVDAAAEFCREDVSLIRDSVNKALSLGMPVPWHGYEVFPVGCPEDGLAAEGYDMTPGQHSLNGLFAQNLKNWQELPAGIRLPALRWWGLAQTYMSDPRVSEVFALLGYDAAGGTIASDEQVMLVAAPIATAYGIPIDEFAVALWGLSPGWASEPGALRYHPYCLAPGDKKGYPTGCNVPRNAWWVQWGIIARTAFELAEGWVDKSPIITKPFKMSLVPLV